ncbi:DUF5316 family protein [Clostridium sp. JNZ J1-5]
MRFLLYGFITDIILFIISITIFEVYLFIKLTAILGIGSLAVSAIISGLLSENIYRRTAVENAEERKKRLKLSTNIFLFSIPSLALFIMFILLYKYKILY